MPLCMYQMQSLSQSIKSNFSLSFLVLMAACTVQVSNNPFMLIFGAFQILLSQIPDFDRLWFLSIVAAVMSFSYSSIGLGLAIGKTTGTLSPPFPISTVLHVLPQTKAPRPPPLHTHTNILVLSFPRSHSYRHSQLIWVVLLSAVLLSAVKDTAGRIRRGLPQPCNVMPDPALVNPD